jgi:hypothetical protein
MDLYPELAVGLGEISPGPFARFCAAWMGWCYRRTTRVVALEEDMAVHLQRRYRVTAQICRPWVFASVVASVAEASNAAVPAREPWTWVYSGNLGRAHEWETLLETQRLIEEGDDTIRLLFQGGGPAWPAAQARAAELGLRRCEWRGYVEETELPRSLLQSAVCVATQRPEAQGLLWPSKVGLLLALPRPLLWIGAADSAIARYLRTLPNAGVFAPGEAQQVADWLHARRATPSVSSAAEHPGERRLSSLDWWSRLLLSIPS